MSDEYDDREVESRLILHSYTRERERQLEKHPDLTPELVDIEAIRLASLEETQGRRANPRAIAKRAVEIVRKASKQKTGREPDSHPLSDREYADFFKSPILKKHKD